MRLIFASVLPLLLVLSIDGTDSTDNEGLSREQKISRRVVRLYNGTRPKPIVCAGEGFQADAEDCRIFHRCIRNGNGRFMSFRFQCGPGTIYDPESEICNHPERTKRSDCGGNMPIHVPNIELPSDNDISKEVPFPMSTKDPSSNRKTTTSSYFTHHTTSNRNESPLASKFQWAFGDHQNPTYVIPTSLPWKLPIKRDESMTTKTTTKRQITESFSSTTASWMSSQKTYTATTSKTNNHRTTSQDGDICTSDGFMGDSENCRKFYRCINNQRGGFIRYEFLCNEPTIWDEDKQSCNHAWAVKRRRCGRGNAINGNEITLINSKLVEPSMNNAPTTAALSAAQNQLQINYGSKVTQIQTQISNGPVIQNQTQINYSNLSPSDEINPSVLQNQTQLSHGSAISQAQTQINYGDKAVQSQLQIDHSKDSSQSQSQISEQTSTIRTTNYYKPETSTSSNTNNVCTESGFMGDSEDCKKFYRCVDNGRGGFIRYEFSCGEGTVWDSAIEACNHAWAVKECGGKAPSKPTIQSTTQTTESSIQPVESSSVTTSTQNYYSSTEEETGDDNDIPYGNQPSSSEPTKPPQQQTTVTKAPQLPNDNNNCKSSGFMGDNRDCKKFYRCVDNGNGGYTRYEFSCGEGTVWDQKIEACNHAWAVENCGASATSDMTSSSTQTTSTQITSQLPPHYDDNDTGYGSQNDDLPASSTTVLSTTLKTPSTTASQAAQTPESNNGNECTSSGFMGDNSDCKKFYRCVDNGNGGYTRYEFTCGEGTVWDQKIQACNHEWAVEKCGGNSVEDINKVETTTKKDTENTSAHSSSTTQTYKPDEDNDVGYGQQSSEPQPISSTSSSPANQGSTTECKSSGFVGDNKDCKKFYRCVDNGDGSFTRYEFVCGEGTVWDSEIGACNHAWAVKTPCSQSINSVQSTTQTSTVDNKTEPSQESTTQKTSTTSSSNSKPGNKCVQEGFYGDENNCKNFYRCVDNGQGGFIKYEFTCGDGTVWNQNIHACDHESPDKNCSVNTSTMESTPSYAKPSTENDEMIPESTTKESSSSVPNSTENNYSQKPQTSNEKCESEGFHGDAGDCKKFYRCVDDGKGGYTKYDFTCGEGTVWDQDILACNHETNNKICSSPGSSFTSTSTSEAEVTEHDSHTSQGYHTTTSTQSSISSSENDHCESEGFFPNSNDCNKFYRCVDNGKGGFTKYDFACGEGTVWVQEIQACDYDNDVSNCSNKGDIQTTQGKPSDTTESLSTSEHTTQSQKPTKEDDEYPNASSSKPPTEGEKCTSEGFFADNNDCTKFYRCVDNGQGDYTKYDFTCGEGTAWDSNLQTCNHINEVESCKNADEQSNNQKPSNGDETTQSSGGTSTTKDGSTTESSQSSSTDKCEQEGFYGNTQDCTKFYRCVDNGNGGLTKYDFTCGEGTIWDQDITTCNHPQDVANPSCSNNQTQSSSSSGSSSTEGFDNTSSSSTQSSQSTSENSNQGSSNCSQECTTKSPVNQDIKCEKAGFYPDPNDCKKFYRCVDWDGNGTRFSVYHFDCGEGTIWDPQLETCNHEDSVYPPRNCSGTQSQSENTQQTTTTEKSTTSEDSSTTEGTTTQSSTEESTTTQQPSTSEQTTQQSSTTEETTSSTQQSTSEQTTQQSTTEKTTTSSSTTTQKTTTEQTTTEQTTTAQEETTLQSTTNQQTTYTEQTTSQETTTTEKSTTQQSTTSEATTQQTTEETSTNTQTTHQSTTDEQTTQQSSSSEHTTQQSSNTEGTTTESTTTEQTISTTEKSNDTSTTEQVTAENTTEKDTSTTESSESTTESESTTSQETSSEKECPETEDDQYLFVCPTSFKRHPKYCNMFYQCTEDDNSHEMKIATFKCPNNTIYDESKIQCVEEEKADKKCNGQIARKYRVKRLHLDYKEPIEASPQKHKCSAIGYYPFEQDECSGGFIKCQKTKSGKFRGYVHRCPDGYVYWSISKKCERQDSMKHCRQSANDWRGRWEIPVERKNIAK